MTDKPTDNDEPDYTDLHDIEEEVLLHALAILNEIDNGDFMVNEWETDFIQSILRQSKNWTFKLSNKQKAVIEKMEAKYLL
jgi:hypothetical protein